MSKSMDFIRDFLKYVESQGIFDEYDKDSNKMVTSGGIQALIKQAQDCLPTPMKKGQAARVMRELNDEERDRLIAEDEDNRVIDLRKMFQEKMSKNNGAHGIVERLVASLETGGPDIQEIIEDAQALVRGPENVVTLKGE